MLKNLDRESFLGKELADFNEILKEKYLVNAVSRNRSPVNLSDIYTPKTKAQVLLAFQVNDSTQDEHESVLQPKYNMCPELNCTSSIIRSSASSARLKEVQHETKSFQNFSGEILESQVGAPTIPTQSEDRALLSDEEILISRLYKETIKDESLSPSTPSTKKRSTLDIGPEEQTFCPSSLPQNEATQSTNCVSILKPLLTQSPNKEFNFRIPSIPPIRRKKKKVQIPSSTQLTRSLSKEFNFPPIRREKKTAQLPFLSHILNPINPKWLFHEVSKEEEWPSTLPHFPSTHERESWYERELREISQLLPELGCDTTQCSVSASSPERSSSRSLVREVAIEDEFLAWTRELA